MASFEGEGDKDVCLATINGESSGNAKCRPGNIHEAPPQHRPDHACPYSGADGQLLPMENERLVNVLRPLTFSLGMHEPREDLQFTR